MIRQSAVSRGQRAHPDARRPQSRFASDKDAFDVAGIRGLHHRTDRVVHWNHVQAFGVDHYDIGVLTMRKALGLVVQAACAGSLEGSKLQNVEGG
jgi:hypothetical protein